MTQVLMVCSVLAVLNAFVALSTAARVSSLGVRAGAVYLCFLAFYAVQTLAPVVDWHWAFLHVEKKSWLLTGFVRLSYLSLGIFSCLMVYALVADVLTLGMRLIFHPVSTLLWDKAILATIALVTAATVVVGFWRLGPPVVVNVSIPVAHLPPAFDGYRIAQISDLHVDSFLDHRYVEKVVRLTNDLHPDMIAVTGDLIDGTVARLGPELVALSDLSAPDGRYFVTGNHEYYWGVDSWTKAVADRGLHVLANTHVVIQRGADQLVLAGVPDETSLRRGQGPKTDIDQALAGAPMHAAKILLAHQPHAYAKAEAAGVSVQISGHTHGGQYFPFTYLIRFFQPLTAGLYREGNLWVYVSRGTGFWGPPLRTNGPPEVTLITLRRGD